MKYIAILTHLCLILSHRILVESLRRTHISLTPLPIRRTAAIGFNRLFSSIGNRILTAVDRAKIECYVNDVNKKLVRGGKSEKLLIVLELGDAFTKSNALNRNSEGKRITISNSDKVSLPETILTNLTDNNVQVPLQFIIQKVHRVHKVDGSGKECLATTLDQPFAIDGREKERVSCSSFDFRWQKNFIYMPKWMMEALNLRPYDLVHLSMARLPEAIFVEIFPMDPNFFKIDNPSIVLESELRYYSTLTKGTVIPIKHGDNVYKLLIVTIDTAKVKDVEFASIQDTDVSVKLTNQLK